MPPLQALDNKPPVVCYYGLDDADDTVCTEPNVPKWIVMHPKKGDHHFQGGYQPLAKQMMDELPVQVSTLAPRAESTQAYWLASVSATLPDMTKRC
jgi:type IV secretory pathway VirJ component